jgi:hypothetical protein
MVLNRAGLVFIGGVRQARHIDAICLADAAGGIDEEPLQGRYSRGDQHRSVKKLGEIASG